MAHVRRHAFEPDAELSREYVTADRRDVGARAWCARCGLPGQPGDDRHPVDAPPRFPDVPGHVRDAERRRLGERGDNDA